MVRDRKELHCRMDGSRLPGLSPFIVLHVSYTKIQWYLLYLTLRSISMSKYWINMMSCVMVNNSVDKTVPQCQERYHHSEAKAVRITLLLSLEKQMLYLFA